jgi:hypothetical protein
MTRKIALEIISFLYVFLFCYAALNKLLDYQKFRLQLSQSPILTSISSLVAIAIPITELVLAVMLTVSRARLLALYLSFGLMVAFTTYIILILNFSYYVPCSCGGVLEKLGWREHLIFNIAFAILGLAGIVFESQQREQLTAR